MITNTRAIMPTRRALGAKLKGYRLIRGADLKQLSEATGIPAASLELYERGTRVPGGDRMLALMLALGLRPGDLVETDKTGKGA